MSLKHSEKVKDILVASDESILDTDSIKKILEKNLTRVKKAKSFNHLPQNVDQKTFNLSKLKWEEKLNKVD